MTDKTQTTKPERVGFESFEEISAREVPSIREALEDANAIIDKLIYLADAKLLSEKARVVDMAREYQKKYGKGCRT